MPVQSIVLCRSCTRDDDDTSETRTDVTARGIATIIRYYPHPQDFVILLAIHPDKDSEENLAFRLAKQADDGRLCILNQLGNGVANSGRVVYLFPHEIRLETPGPGLYAIEVLGQLASDEAPNVKARYWFHVVMD